ncbi:MAG: ribonuclease P protein component [Pseudomonadota bacterium]
MPPTQPRLRLGAELRLRSKLQFDALYASGKRIDDRFFGLRVRPNGLGFPRIGLAVAVKTAGNAVKRNRLRRLVRETFRLVQHELPAVDIVVAAKFPSAAAPASTLRDSLATLWQRVVRTCASS